MKPLLRLELQQNAPDDDAPDSPAIETLPHTPSRDNDCILRLMEQIFDVCIKSGVDRVRQLAAINAVAVANQAMFLNPNISEDALEGIVLKSILVDLCQNGAVTLKAGNHA